MTGPKETKENPFGVLEFLHWSHPWNHYKYADKKDLVKAAELMQEAGIGIVRMDFLWQDIEPKKGERNFEKYDYIVELLSAHKIKILGLLDYSVEWASASGKWNCAPQDFKEFVEYATAVAKRYKGRITYWEIWNEPDSSTYWEPQDGLKSYCALLKETYAALKQVDPGCRVLNGGLANGLASVNKLYDNGAQGYFDILNIHIFEQPFAPGAIHRVTAYPRLAYKIMQRNNDGNKEIWITEIGCPGVKKGQAANNWWLGGNPDEELQAAWLTKVYEALLEERHVGKIFWAFLRDCQDHWHSGVDYFGLVRWDFSKKPAFVAYRDYVLNREKQKGSK